MQSLLHSLELGLLSPVYLFYGEEKLLMEDAVQKITALVAPGDAAWNKELFHGDEVRPQQVVESAECSAFFAERKLIVVRNVSWFQPARKKAQAEDGAEPEPKQDVEILLQYVADPNPSTVLVLLAEGNISAASRIAKAVTKSGRVVEFVTQKGSARDLWLKNYFHAAGKVPEPGVLSYLNLMCAEGLDALKAEADKLILYTEGKTHITQEDAEAVTSKSALAGVFDLTDHVAAGRASAAAGCYRQLLKQNTAAQMLLGQLGSQYRNMLAAKDMEQRGFNATQIASTLKINPYYAKKCLAQSKRYGIRQLVRILDILLSVDIDSKSGKGDVNDLLEVAILRICMLRPQ